MEKADFLMGRESSINWGFDPYGRRGQIQRGFWELESFTQDLTSDLDKARAAIPHLENDNRNRVNDAARSAYAAIEDVVKTLLTIDNGDKSLSKDTIISDKLTAAVKKFEVLAEASKNNMSAYGLTSGNSMALGDKSSTFEREVLKPFMESLNEQSKDIYALVNNAQSDLKRAQDRGVELNRQYDEAREDASSFGGQVSSIFNNDARDKVNAARDRCSDNNRDVAVAMDKKEAYYQLCIFTRNASAALACLRDRVNTVAREFDEDYARVSHCLEVESGLMSGLLKLRNHISNADFGYTRDNSLKVILGLLTADDEVFQRQSFYEDTEERIKQAIRVRLGNDGVEKILHPPVPSSALDQF